MSNDEGKRFAERAAGTASEALEEGGTAAEKSARGIEQSYFVAAEGIRDFNARLIEMAHTNTLAALDLVREVSAAEGPSEAASLWSSHAQKQFQAMAEQSRELTALAQRIATSSAEPITRSFGAAYGGTT